jgi:hypothetical protein
MKSPAYLWYPSRWRSHPAHARGPETRDLAREMMDMMAESHQPGFLPYDELTIANYCGCPLDRYRLIVEDLVKLHYFGRNAQGVLYSELQIEILAKRDHKRNQWREQKQQQRNNGVPAKQKQIPWADPAFDLFYETYPKRQGRSTPREPAERAWRKIKASDIPAIMQALMELKSCEEWQRNNGQYVPYASTWLNQKRWQDPRQAASSGFSASPGPHLMLNPPD